AKRVLASVVLPAPERYPTSEKRSAFYRRILDAVRAIPGVEDAGTVDALPFSGENHGGQLDKRIAEIDIVGGHYLQAMGIRRSEGSAARSPLSIPTNRFSSVRRCGISSPTRSRTAVSL